MMVGGTLWRAAFLCFFRQKQTSKSKMEVIFKNVKK
jgi:hypothetical protein